MTQNLLRENIERTIGVRATNEINRDLRNSRRIPQQSSVTFCKTKM